MVFKTKQDKNTQQPHPTSQLTPPEAGWQTDRQHLLRPHPTSIILHLTAGLGASRRWCLCFHFGKSKKNPDKRTDKVLLYKLEITVGLLPLLTFKCANAWRTNQDQYTKNATRWQLHWWLDSQKHQPCNSTYSNNEAGRKNVSGKK